TGSIPFVCFRSRIAERTGLHPLCRRHLRRCGSAGDRMRLEAGSLGTKEQAMAEATVELNELNFAGDDRVVPFQVEGLDVRGRAVQLGPLLNAILGRHEYPAPVARLLAEAMVLTALLGTSLKFDGKLTVQTKG